MAKKKLRFFQETTANVDYPLHVYVLDKDRYRCYAYIQAGTNRHVVFNKPINFDPRTRIFRDLGALN